MTTSVASEHRQGQHRRGVLVTVHCRTGRAEADSVLQRLDGDGHVVVQGDLASPDDVRRFVGEAIEALGRIDVLVNNAALFAEDPATQGHRLSLDVAQSSYEQWVSAWRRTTEVNLLGTANVTYQVVRHMIEV